jgi:glucosamine--fructose-6-phosphate aminotransferase (isomerizing)
MYTFPGEIFLYRLFYLGHTSTFSMCGILAILLGAASSDSHQCFNFLLSGLRALQNRGYDSCGVVGPQFEGYLRAVKGTELNGAFDKSLPDDAVDQLELCKAKFPEQAATGMGHTRWATHGAKRVINAHPHLSSDQNFAVIHNGIIENCVPLREKLESKGWNFLSETDTEVISNWLADYLKQLGTEPSPGVILRVLREGQRVFEGTWAIAVMHKSLPDHIFVCKKGSPLLVGGDSGGNVLMATSEVAGFVNRVQRYAVVDEGDVLELRKGMSVRDLKRCYPNLEFHALPKEKIRLVPDPFPHWMSKEIYDQKQACQGPAEWGIHRDKMLGEIPELQAVFQLRERLLTNSPFDVLIVGCGTSYHAGLSGRWFFRHAPFRTVRVVVASEFTKQDLPKLQNGLQNNVLAIMISQSGETKDVHRALAVIKRARIPTIALVNVPNSMIARECDLAVHLHAGREVAVASTKAYISQVVGLRLLALALEYGPETKIPDDCLTLEHQINEVLQYYFPYIETRAGVYHFDMHPRMKRMADALHQKNHGFILSSGKLRATSYEAALKIKEISRVWAQGYPTGALKHGPFSLIEKGTPVLFALQDGDDQIRKRTEAAIEEVYARKARVFIVTDIADYESKHAEDVLHIPRNKQFASILHILPFQILSYYLSLFRRLDPDKPIHLAKVVTTD